MHLQLSGTTTQSQNIWTDRSEQTVQSQIRLPLKEQSDQGLNCLPFHMQLVGALLNWKL